MSVFVNSSNRNTDSPIFVNQAFTYATLLVSLALGAADLVQSGGVVSLRQDIDFVSYTTLSVSVTAILLAGALMFIRLRPWQDRGHRRERHLCSVAVVVLLVSALDDRSYGIFPDRWSGFGVVPTFIAVSCTSLIFAMAPQLPDLGAKLGPLARILGFAVLGVYLPVFVQPPHGLLNFGDTTYHVIDELLAPMTGSHPYTDYSPTYAGIWGWVIFPLKWLPLSADATMTIVVWFCNLCLFAMPVLAAISIRHLYPRLPILLLLIGYVSLNCVSGYTNGSSTELAQFATFARGLPMLLLLAVVARIHSPALRRQRISFAILGGCLCGFNVLNGADFGLLVGVLTAGVFLLCTYLYKSEMFLALAFSGTAIAFVACYTVFLAATSGGFLIESYLGIRLGFDADFYEPFALGMVGPHVIFFAAAAAGLIHFGTKIIHPEKSPADLGRVVFGLSSSLWLILALTKWMLQARPQSLNQVFVPAALVMSVLLGEVSANGFRSWIRRDRNIAPLLVTLSLSVGAITQAPYPVDELARASGNHVNTTNWSTTPGRPSDGYSREALAVYDDFIARTEVTRNQICAGSLSCSSTVAYFGIHGSTVELLLGIDNVFGISAPENLRFGVNMEHLACIPVYAKQPEYVIVYSSEFPCGGYYLNKTQSSDSLQVFHRNSNAATHDWGE